MSSIAPTILVGTAIDLDDSMFMAGHGPHVPPACRFALALAGVFRNAAPPLPPVEGEERRLAEH